MISPRPSSADPVERRRDRRLTVTGDAVMWTLEGRAELHGGVVDVSAGGLRLRLRPGDLPRVGEFTSIDVRVTPGVARGEAATVRLSGFAEVVRVERRGEGTTDVAVRFLDPLRVRDDFELAAPAEDPA